MSESDPMNPAVPQSKDWFDRSLRAIKEVGFPIVVCIFLFWDRATVMKEFQATLTQLTVAINELRAAVKKGDH